MIIAILCGAAICVVVAMVGAMVVSERRWKRRVARRRQSDPGNMTEDEVAALIDNAR